MIFTSHNFGPLTCSCVHEQIAQWTCIMHRVGTVDRCGYGGQQKGTICDVHGPCLSIWHSLKPISCQIRSMSCLRVTYIPTSRDMASFMATTTTMTTQPITLPLAHAPDQGDLITLHLHPVHLSIYYFKTSIIIIMIRLGLVWSMRVYWQSYL